MRCALKDTTHLCQSLADCRVLSAFLCRVLTLIPLCVKMFIYFIVIGADYGTFCFKMPTVRSE